MAKLRLLISLVVMIITSSLSLVIVASETVDVKYYEQDDITNQIPYFDNRFHIDAQLEEITLLFYRRNGSPPIILVRPDGSKLKINNLPKDEVEWFDDKTFDMIRIRKPMPGPWQAIGDILPNSKIMVVSEVTLHVEPFDEIIFSGETLKVLGHILNRDKVVEDPLFNDVIKLNIDFYSTNNTAFDNFGAEPIEIGTFRDDGYELDEYARDGIFTAEFELDFSAGEWIPIYRVIMPMATRELRQKPIILRANPIKIEVETTTDPLEFHKMKLVIDETYVDPDSLIFQGKITFPDRQSEPFSIMEGAGNFRQKKIGYTEPGVHRISVNAFGQTINGREFRLVVPDFTFNVEIADVLLVPSMGDDSGVSSSEIAALELQEKLAAEKEQYELELAQAQAEQEAIKADKKKQTYILIGILNSIVIIMAIGVFFFLRRKKK